MLSLTSQQTGKPENQKAIIPDNHVSGIMAFWSFTIEIFPVQEAI